MPTAIRWQVPTNLSAAERRLADKLHRIGKFYVFLREIRAELFDEGLEAELAAAYRPRGVAPLPPALLAMVTLLQAYDQVGDAEAVVGLAEVDGGLGVDRGRHVPRLGQDVGERHREAAGVGRGDEFLGVGPLALFESGVEREGPLEGSGTERHRAGAFLQVALPAG